MTSPRGASRKAGPLQGIRVLELGGIGPVPFAGMMLADYGADVVRIDRPGAAGPEGMDHRHHLMNRGRRSVAVDLQAPGAVEQVLDLIGAADVVIEGFRPGVVERLGIGPEPALARNPRIVYGRQTGWGQQGPLSQRAGHDVNYIARTGALHAIGAAGGPPVIPLNLVGDFAGGGMLLVVGVLCALAERSRSGLGQVIDSAMVDGANLLMTMFHGLIADGSWRDVRGDNLIDGGEPFYAIYETADDRHMSVGPLEPKFFAELCQVLGISPVPDRAPGWDAAGARESIAAAFRTRTQAEWEREFDGVDACVAPVRGLLEAPTDAHLAARNSFVDIGGIVQPAAAPRFSRSATVPVDPPPVPGQDTAEVLQDWLGAVVAPEQQEVGV
jgi:alpha-methylacyl-CoA racemase